MADSRTYIRVHDGMPDHPKISRLDDDAASWLLVCLWAYCSRYLTDGRVPATIAHRLTKDASKARCRKLVAAGLLEEDGADYVCHDYLEHQRSADEVAAARERNAANGRAGGLARAKQVASKSLGKSRSESPSPAVASTETETTTDKNNPSSRKRDSDPDGFAAFWMAYPRKDDKGKAILAYRKALKTTEAATLAAAAGRYARERQGQDSTYTKLPATWLNAQSWANEPPPPARPSWENFVAVKL